MIKKLIKLDKNILNKPYFLRKEKTTQFLFFKKKNDAKLSNL